MPDEPKTNDIQDATKTQVVKFDLSQALQNPESKAAIQTYVDEQLRPIKSALESTKSRLHSYKIDEKENGDPIYADPDEVKNLFEKMKNGKIKNQDSANEDLKKALDAQRQKLIKDDVEPLRKELEQEKAFTRKVLIDQQLQSELIKQNIHKGLMEGALLILKQQLDILVEGDNRIVIVLDREGKPKFGANGRMTLEEFVKDFAASENGKHWFLAPQNTGGGVQTPTGSHSGGNAGQANFSILGIKTKADVKKLPINEQPTMISKIGHENYLALPEK